MLKELLEHTDKYFWSLNKDGDVILGSTDIEPKARIIFTITDQWVNVAPVVEKRPNVYIGKSHNYMQNSPEYRDIVKLVKKVTKYLKKHPEIDQDWAFKNTMKLLQDYYQE